jgi:hypothetical protein
MAPRRSRPRTCSTSRLAAGSSGIRKPRKLSAALSIRTVYTPDGQTRPYDDSVGSDGLLRYKWRGDNPDQAENKALRATMENRLPLIWFFGVGPGLYEPVYPVYLLWEEPNHRQFVIDPDVARGLVSANTPVEKRLRRYILRETRQRLHPVRRCSEHTTRAARCALSGTESYSTQLTSSPTMTKQESRQFVTGCRSARSTTQPTTAISDLTSSSKFDRTYSTKSTARCYSMGCKSGMANV